MVEFVLDVFEDIGVGDEVESGSGNGVGSKNEGFVTNAHARMSHSAPGVKRIKERTRCSDKFQSRCFPANVAYIGGSMPYQSFIPRFFDSVAEGQVEEFFPVGVSECCKSCTFLVGC